MPPKSAKTNTITTITSATTQVIIQPSTTTQMVDATTTEEEDNTTTEDETTQDSECEMPLGQLTVSGRLSEMPQGQLTVSGSILPAIQELQAEESEEESEDSASEPEDGESETEVQFIRSALLEQLGTQSTGLLAPGTWLYLLTGQALTKFVRLTKYHTYGNPMATDVATKLAIDIARSQQVVAPLTAINTQDGELFVIDDVYNLMALRNLSDGVLEKLTVMLVVYEFRALADPPAKALFTRLNTRQQFTIETQSVSDIDQFMAIILANPAIKDGIKSSAANKKANFPHVSSSELRKSFQEVISRVSTTGSKPDISSLANRLIDFNCICKGKPISTLFGLHISGSTHTGDAIDEKTRERYKKMVAKDFYLASPYGRQWPQFLLGRADTEIIAVQKGSSAAVIPTISQKFSFTLKKV